MNADNNYSNPWTASYKKPKNVSKVDVCAEFQEEQDCNVAVILAAFENEEQTKIARLRDEVKQELTAQYERDCATYDYQKSQEGWQTRWVTNPIWGSDLTPPIHPTDETIDAQVQKIISFTNEIKENRGWAPSEYMSIATEIITLRERHAYYENGYASDQKQLRKMTKAEIAILFACRECYLKEKQKIVVDGTAYHDYDMVPAQDGSRPSSAIFYPIGVVLKGENGTCKAEQDLQKEHKSEENDQDAQVDMTEEWFYTA